MLASLSFCASIVVEPLHRHTSQHFSLDCNAGIPVPTCIVGWAKAMVRFKANLYL